MATRLYQTFIRSLNEANIVDHGPVPEPVAQVQADNSPAVCRICFGTDEQVVADPFLQPCHCSGSQGDVHFNCLSQWIEASKSDACGICTAKYMGVHLQLYTPRFGQYVATFDTTNFSLALGLFAIIDILALVNLLGYGCWYTWSLSSDNVMNALSLLVAGCSVLMSLFILVLIGFVIWTVRLFFQAWRILNTRTVVTLVNQGEV